jgi:hypothetical protein
MDKVSHHRHLVTMATPGGRSAPHDTDCETKWFVAWFIYVMSNCLGLVWIWIWCILVELTLDWVIRFGKMCLLVLSCVGDECDMAGTEDDQGRSRRIGAEDRGWSGTSRVLGGRMIRRSGDTMCDPHHTHGGDEKRGLPSLASKSVTTICEWFGLKTTTTVSLCHILKFSFRNVNHFFPQET